MSSQMIIKVTDVEVGKGTTKTNKPYEFLDVTYKNVTFDNKPEAKKIMPFGSKEVFATLKEATKGDVFTILREKDDAGYWQWVGIAAGETEIEDAPKAAAAATKPQTAAAPKSNFETPEERAKRQILIVRQSCLANAVEFLNHNQKNYKVVEALEIAGVMYDWVFGNDQKAQQAEVPALPDDEDIPY